MSVFFSVLLVEGLTRCPASALPAESAVFWCQKQAWQEWHSRTPHHVARAQPVLCMLNWQLKSSATTSPRPLIRDSLLPCSLYPVSAGNPFVYGILEDCSDCNRGSFISAGPGGGPPRIPSHLYGLGYRSSGWALSRTAGAVRWAIGSFRARQDWWAPSARGMDGNGWFPVSAPLSETTQTQVLLRGRYQVRSERDSTFLLIQVWPVDNRQAILPLLEGQPICVFGGWLWSSLCLCCGAVGKANRFQNALWSYLGKICWSGLSKALKHYLLI